MLHGIGAEINSGDEFEIQPYCHAARRVAVLRAACVFIVRSLFQISCTPSFKIQAVASRQSRF